MDLKFVRRVAAEILKCGENRVYITNDPARQDDLGDAITRDAIRKLIERGDTILKRPVAGVSRGRAKARAAQREKGRRRGVGSREGATNARFPRKRRWILRIRAIRVRLRELKGQGRIDVSTYRKFYRQAKGGMFHSRAHLEQQLRAAGYLTGWLAGKRAAAKGITAAVLDLGRQHPTKGGRLFAVLKGLLDAGVEIPHDEAVLPSPDRVQGAHLKGGAAERFQSTKSKVEGA